MVVVVLVALQSRSLVGFHLAVLASWLVALSNLVVLEPFLLSFPLKEFGLGLVRLVVEEQKKA